MLLPSLLSIRVEVDIQDITIVHVRLRTVARSVVKVFRAVKVDFVVLLAGPAHGLAVVGRLWDDARLLQVELAWGLL